MTDDRRGEDEFKKLLRDSIDGRGTDREAENASWGEQEDVYTPSAPQSANSAELKRKQHRKQANGGQEWNQNIGSAVYALKNQQVVEDEDTAAHSLPLSLSLSEAEKGDSDTKGKPVSPKPGDARQPSPSQPGRTVNWGLRLVSAVAVILLAAWFVLRDQQGLSRLSGVEQHIDSLQQQVVDVEKDAVDRERMEQRLADVEAKMAELSREVPTLQRPEAALSLIEEGLRRQLSEQKQQLSEQKQRLEAFVDHVAELEKEVSLLPKVPAGPDRVVSGAGRKAPAGRSKVVADAGGNEPGAGKSAAGQWAINLMTVTHSSYAARLLARYRKMGIEAEQLEINHNGKRMYRLRVSGFPTKIAAEVYAGEVRSKLGLKDTWVTSR